MGNPGLIKDLMLEFLEVKNFREIQIVADLAHRIWNEHYVPIIGQEQVDYMLAKFQSIPAIEEQIEQASRYYLIRLENEDIGYFSLNLHEKEQSLELSKLYVQKEYKGRKIGRKAVEFIQALGRQLGAKKIFLSVNKYNPSIAAYESMGFKCKQAVVQDIGAGFVMDDYVYEKEI